MSLKGKEVAVLVPAYNEGETVRGVIEEVRRALPDAEIVVIDDGSTDRTAEAARLAGAVVLELPFNVGIGGAMQTGFLYAKERGFSAAVQVDGDGQHTPAEIPRLLDELDRGADMVIGSRFVERGAYRAPLSRRLGMLFFAFTISTLVGRKFHDTTSGFRASGIRAIEYFANRYPSDYPEPEAIVLLCRAGLHVREIPATIRERGGGASSITFLRSIYYMIKVFLAITMGMTRPLASPKKESPK